MAPFLTCAIAAPAGGWLCDRLCTRYGKRIGRCGLAACAMSLTGILILLGAVTADPLLAVAVLSISLGSLYLSLSAFWAVTIDLTHEYAGTASGFMNMGGNLGGAISPTLMPYLAGRYDWEMSLTVMGGFCFVGALCWLGIYPDRRIEDTARD
jgi:ACS family glucarate transporter-like MFS transporter